MKYAAPTTVDEARELVAATPGAAVFAGATDLIPQIRDGRPEPPLLIDLKRIDRLMSVSESGGVWTIGAAVPTSQLTANAALRNAFPGLVEASRLIGSDQIQNRASWGGNLCTASPAADTVPALVVHGAQAVVATGTGERTMAVLDIPTGKGQIALSDDEFIVEFTLAAPPPETGDAYLRLTPRTEMDIAVVSAAVRVTLSGDTCTAASVALGAVAPTVIAVPEAEAALVGASVASASVAGANLASASIDESALAAVGAAASAAADPITDKRGTAEYRTQVAGVLARRAAAIAAGRARGGHR